jgi:hypothetical protein
MAKRLPYKYKVKFNEIKSLFKTIQFITFESEFNSRAKAVLRSLCNRVKNKTLTPDSEGYIIISGSDGDKIIKSKFNIRLKLSKIPTVTIDTTNEWWQN